MVNNLMTVKFWKSNEILQKLLDEEMNPSPSELVDKGKGKMEEEERLMRGFSPHS